MNKADNEEELVREAYAELFGAKRFTYEISITYTRRLKDYNARVSKAMAKLDFRFSTLWEGVDSDIWTGLVQELLCKVFGLKKDTERMQLYRLYIKKVALNTPAEEFEPWLKDSFARVNVRYFDSLLEMPNLKFGRYSKRTLGSYNFHNNTVMISRVLENAPEELLDYVMYHELLHMREQYDHRKRRPRHHDKNFRVLEKQFEGSRAIERKLNDYVRNFRT